MTKQEARQLRKIIDEFVDASICNSWKGAQDPADIAELELDLLKAEMKLKDFIKELTTEE